ncbi:peptide ABC transporter ATP-binding protein [Flavonifractor sp. An92]|uniref:ABC transporter ATP-binding protein n=1 Tax=Flavonifractor sp. An92 TaxID=1965666 RepID=UPI000B39DFF9|nr:ABC transporter ATP-binding protein [Flavonifractor sp. An92]OUN06835.1 peptide ABC transporter ATP-binding protein [Flavonifractor sp. An92]
MAEHQRALLEVRDLRVSFFTPVGQVRAVNGISYTVERGGVMGIVGESGSGKSVEAYSVLGLLPPTGRVVGGSISFEGRDVLSLSEGELTRFRGNEVAMIFQNPMTCLNPVYTVGFQLTEALRAHDRTVKRDEANARAVEMLELVGINNPQKRMKQYPHQLSGGQRQRVMIAMALICKPKLLIADEPTTALDVTIQAQILDLMKEIQQKTGMGILFITHNLGVVAEICDNVSVMYAGRIVEQGGVEDIFYRPGHPYTLGLLRSMPRVDVGSRERLIPIPGTPVDMLDPPPGCPFAPRCESCMQVCLEKAPPDVTLGEGHRAACWLRVREQLQARREGAYHE